MGWGRRASDILQTATLFPEPFMRHRIFHNDPAKESLVSLLFRQGRDRGYTLIQGNTLINPTHMKWLIWPQNAAARIHRHPREGIPVVSYLPSTQQNEKTLRTYSAKNIKLLYFKISKMLPQPSTSSYLKVLLSFDR